VLLSRLEHPVRALLVTSLFFVAACFGKVALEDAQAGDDNPTPEPAFAICNVDADCIPAAATCCECPTFATRFDDPKAAVCDDVDCPMSDCPDNVSPVCDSTIGQCVLVCKPLVCETTCASGYAVDGAGCLTCACAEPPPSNAGGCRDDGECVRTRADCCGCERGGFDTAVLASQAAGFDDGLMCESDPACPGNNTCTADQPTCAQGFCQLLPPKPPGTCGSASDAACPANTVCTVNANDQANLYGLGVCLPPP
jgi:hypothetical protein